MRRRGDDAVQGIDSAQRRDACRGPDRRPRREPRLHADRTHVQKCRSRPVVSRAALRKPDAAPRPKRQTSRKRGIKARRSPCDGRSTTPLRIRPSIARVRRPTSAMVAHDRRTVTDSRSAIPAAVMPVPAPCQARRRHEQSDGSTCDGHPHSDQPPRHQLPTISDNALHEGLLAESRSAACKRLAPRRMSTHVSFPRRRHYSGFSVATQAIPRSTAPRVQTTAAACRVGTKSGSDRRATHARAQVLDL